MEDAEATSTPELSARAQRAIRSNEKELAKHESKLAEYRKDPFAFDNKGHLARNPDPQIQQKIISTRIHHLESEIDNFRAVIKRLRSGIEP